MLLYVLLSIFLVFLWAVVFDWCYTITTLNLFRPTDTVHADDGKGWK